MTNPDPGLPQSVASDPAHSAWVTANAGSGKTKVLIDRVARLLLGRPGDAPAPDPSKILCLTYTRAAAANMQNQLFKRLGGWALLDDPELRDELKKLAPNRAEDVDLKRARRLFAQALETPGGLKIQTIHAFCESLLRRFPLEAAVSPHFTLLDEVETRALTRDAAERAIRFALSGTNAALRDATERVIGRVQEAGLAPIVTHIIGSRPLFEPTLDTINARIGAALGVGPGDTAADALTAYDSEVPWPAIRDLAWVYAEHGGAHETKVAPALFDAIDDGDAAERLAAIRAAFLTAKGEPRKIGKGFPTKAVKNEDPNAEHLVETEQARLVALSERLRAIETTAHSRALARFAKAVLREVAALKTAKDAVDFDDLIRMAGALLNRADARDWVRYKLDGGVDHILVDEAQDTSVEQWQVIAAIAEEFFAGDGARETHRTLFVVGDEKQSIYSFQGADPEQLNKMQARFDALVQMEKPELLHSFRSTPAVLSAVDLVFAADAAQDGLGDKPPVHLAFRENRPGRVEFWPPAGPREEPESVPWWQPVDLTPPDAPHLRLADAIAQRCADWIGKAALPACGRKIRAGDILILVRRRNVFADAMIRALKAKGLPVAGEDRMILTDQLAVKDLLALARFALLPDDDLTLATVLRSPIVGLSEAALFDLSHGRQGRLWHTLVRRRGEFPEAHAILADMLAQADIMRPYEFFEHALGHHGARARLLGRLGVQAEDPIDELLAQALAFETAEIPTLQAFVERIDAAGFQVKREMEQGRDEIRVMTAHGAKGLEANIVFLPDTVALPPVQTTGLFAIDTPDGKAPIWSRPATEDPPPAAASRAERREREMQEYRRLLYVGMTRARDWLVVCGYHGARGPKPESWVSLVESGFSEAVECDTPLTDDADQPLTGLAIESMGDGVDRDETAEVAGEAAAPPVPALMQDASDEGKVQAALAPSRLTQDDPTEPWPLPSEGEEAEEPVSSAERGTLMHALLERLARLPEEARRVEGTRGLTPPRASPSDLIRGSLSTEQDPRVEREGDNALEAVLTILATPDFAWMFGENSYAEIPIAGPVAALGRAVSGNIDRLVIGEKTIDIVDFKSGRPPETIPEPYLRQLAVYRATLTEIYPERDVRAHLLWLDAARLDTPPATDLDAALDRVRAAL